MSRYAFESSGWIISIEHQNRVLPKIGCGKPGFLPLGKYAACLVAGGVIASVFLFSALRVDPGCSNALGQDLIKVQAYMTLAAQIDRSTGAIYRTFGGIQRAVSADARLE